MNDISINKKPVLFLHIGSMKTGTTSLQHFLAKNQKILMENQICYSGLPKNWSNHENIMFNLIKEYLEKNDVPIIIKEERLEKYLDPNENIINRIKSDFYRNNCEILLISYEGFWYSTDISYFEYPKNIKFFKIKEFVMNYFKEAFKEFDIKIVCYLRRQDDYIESHYNQNGKYSSINSFEDNKNISDALLFKRIKEVKNGADNYYKKLSEWAKIYGKENIIVRTFEKSILQKGVEYDFCTNILNLNGDFIETKMKPVERVNESMKKDIVEYKLSTKLFNFKDNFYKLNDNPALSWLDENSKKNILTAKQANELLEYCKEDNEKIAREYLNREDGVLFYDKPREEKDDYPGLSTQAVLDISRELAILLDNDNKRLQIELDDVNRRLALSKTDLNNDWMLPCPPEQYEPEWVNSVPLEIIKINEMSWHQRFFITGLVRMTRPVKLVEFGVSAGGSSGILLNAISDNSNAKLISVDVMEYWYKDRDKKVGWAVYENYKNNLSQWTLMTGKDPIEVIEKQIGSDIDFCLIDTAHIHPIEILNFLTVLPFLKNGAIVVLHDIMLSSLRLPPERALELNSNRAKECYGATYLFSHVVADKIVPQKDGGSNNILIYPNIGAFRVTADTRKYIKNLFLSMFLEWRSKKLTNELIKKFEIFFDKYYDVECSDLFKRAVRTQEYMKEIDNEQTFPKQRPTLKGIRVVPNFEYENFLDWCQKYDPEKDILVMHPAAKPKFTAVYKNCKKDKLSFTIQSLHPNAINPMHILWELHSADGTVISSGDEDAHVPHTVTIDIPFKNSDLKLNVRLEYDPKISVAFCGISLKEWAYYETK